eukprot:TRINITY_DN8430_c0_g1_i1.p1 TRINITY_DN8430_c0_g1~~TRINITY_DN8430_c0_g1_i1.p1  ORF type:complete len:154 (+),score=39.39 TRINITY_DN8430_c0_g1_i1:349-810(+)
MDGYAYNGLTVHKLNRGKRWRRGSGDDVSSHLVPHNNINSSAFDSIDLCKPMKSSGNNVLRCPPNSPADRNVVTYNTPLHQSPSHHPTPPCLDIVYHYDLSSSTSPSLSPSYYVHPYEPHQQHSQNPLSSSSPAIFHPYIPHHPHYIPLNSVM